MPKKVHDRLKRQAEKKHLTGDRKDAYIYGTLDKIDKKHDSGTHKKSVKRGKSRS